MCMDNLVVYILFDRQTTAMGKGRNCFFYYGKSVFLHQIADVMWKKMSGLISFTKWLANCDDPTNLYKHLTWFMVCHSPVPRWSLARVIIIAIWILSMIIS